MTITHLLAVVPAADFDAAHSWYARLLGRPADNAPMAGLLVEWQVTENGWLQLTHDDTRAGTGLLNFAVDDLPAHLAELRGRGFEPGESVQANKGVQLSTIVDPEGNTITFIGHFREVY
jgi:catechol 2,3-dioxygenase-like lactoylglutathione lyase family enzyme